MRVTASTQRRVLALLVLAIVALVGRFLANALGAPSIVARALYIFALASLVACVLVIATD